MAGKGRRAAARQGELSRRRKRTQRGPSGIPSAEQTSAAPVAVASDDAEVTAVAAEGEPQAVAAAPSVAEQPVQPVAAQRPQGRIRGERPAAYNYVGAEIRRIGVLSAVVIVALVALSVVL